MIEMINVENFDDYSLLDPSNPIYDDPELEEMYGNVLNLLAESSDLSPNDYKPGDVCIVTFPFMDFQNGSKTRRVLIVNLPDGELGCLMISSINLKSKSKIRKMNNSKYNHIIAKWYIKNSGFTKPCFSVGSSVIPLNFFSKIIKVGVMDLDDYIRCVNGMNTFYLDKFNSPWLFMNYLKNSLFKETFKEESGINPIQTLEDLSKRKSCNSIDIANATHNICVKQGISHKIILVRFHYNNEDLYHMFVVFRTNKHIYSFRFITDKDLPKGDIYTYKTGNLNTCIEKEVNFFKEYFDKNISIPKVCDYAVFDDKSINLLDSAFKNHDSQKMILRELRKSLKFQFIDDGEFIDKLTLEVMYII